MAGIDILASAFSGANAAFLADLYARWVSNPSSVDPSFADLFEAMNDEARAVLEDASGASWAPRPSFGEPEAAAQRRWQYSLGQDHRADRVRGHVPPGNRGSEREGAGRHMRVVEAGAQPARGGRHHGR